MTEGVGISDGLHERGKRSEGKQATRGTMPGKFKKKFLKDGGKRHLIWIKGRKKEAVSRFRIKEESERSAMSLRPRAETRDCVVITVGRNFFAFFLR